MTVSRKRIYSFVLVSVLLGFIFGIVQFQIKARRMAKTKRNRNQNKNLRAAYLRDEIKQGRHF